MVLRIISLFLLLLSFGLNTTKLYGQDDLLNMLSQDNQSKPVPVYATFKATRLITNQTNETVAKKHLNFIILHRFGEINKGAYELFGLDQANIRLAFDYGVSDKIQIGVARSSFQKTYDGNLKVKVLTQTKGKGSMPISLTYYGNMAVNTLEWPDKNRNNYFTSRLTYLNQIIVTRKFSDKLSVMLTPTVFHQNLVPKKSDDNLTFSVGLGSSIKLTRSTRFNIEYFPRITGTGNSTPAGNTLYNYLGIGFDIETGGHVFQLMLTNGVGMLEQHAIAFTNTSWNNAGIRLGFNLSRTFSFDKSEKSW